MLGLRIIIPIFLIAVLFSHAQEDKKQADNPAPPTVVEEKKEEKKPEYTPEELKEFEEEYKLAVLMYNRGSYYTALNILSKIVNDRYNPYYPQALFLSAKIYLNLGIKTGIKEFLQKALYYINTYSYSVENPFTWDFYYTKGIIYENLFMYERALALYKMAFALADTPRKQFKTVIAILRTAAWLKRMDIITRYIILVNLEQLSEKEKKEFEFVKGLVEFQKGNYREAVKYLIPVYKTYEQYLIENPNYYLILGEAAYRVGSYDFAKQIFRRMISLVKDESVIRKALLRLGDIALKKGDKILAFNYYYEVIKKYPNTDEATIAKLKLIALERDSDIKRRLLLTEDKDYIDPLGFVLKTLISNRNNYVGFFALGNFGYIALNSKSEKLFDKLTWELSLVNVSRLRYEHIEYIRQLWAPEIKKLPYMRGCKLFNANKRFFYRVFGRDTLLVLYNDLKKCGKYETALELAKFIAKKWNDDKSLLVLADAYFSKRDFNRSLKTLEKIKNRNCSYYILKGKNLIFLKKVDMNLEKDILRVCKTDSVEKYIILSYISVELGNLKKAVEYIDKVVDKLPEYYRDNTLGRIFLRKLVYGLFEKKMYGEALKIILPVSEMQKEDCDLNSWVLIAAVRSDKKWIADDYFKRIEGCQTRWSLVAKNVYQDYLILGSLKNE
ncbi:tetratricopeptide repeat protein [Persephonella sp.]